MDFFYDGKHTISCDSEQTVSYLCGVGFVTHYMHELHVTGKKDTITSLHLDKKTAEQHLNRMYSFYASEYHEIKDSSVINTSDVNYKGVFTSLSYAKEYIGNFYKENYKRLCLFTERKMYTKHLNVEHLEYEDIVQQAFLKLLNRKLTIPVYELMPYMKTTITNLINDELRKIQSLQKISSKSFMPLDMVTSKDIIDDDDCELDGYTINNKEDEIMLSALRKHYPQILLPHLIDGETIKETARRGNVSERTIKYELKRLKNKLQKHTKTRK